MTKIQITPARRHVKPANFYVYLHKKKTNSEIFNVGMGSGYRGWSSHKRNPKWTNIAMKHGVVIDVVQEGMSKDQAFLLEMWLIAKFRHEGANLANLTDGGDGANGVEQALESNIKRRDTSGGRAVFCSNGKMFHTASEAGRWLVSEGHSKGSPGGVSMACRGLTGTYLGFRWSYDGFPEPPDYTVNEARTKRIMERLAVRVSNDLGEDYPSMSDAVRFLRENGYPKAVTNGISLNTRGKIKYAYGRVWTRHDKDL